MPGPLPEAALSAAIWSKTSGGMSSFIAEDDNGAEPLGRAAEIEQVQEMSKAASRDRWNRTALTCMFPSKGHECLPAIGAQQRIQDGWIFHQFRRGSDLDQEIQVVLKPVQKSVRCRLIWTKMNTYNREQLSRLKERDQVEVTEPLRQVLLLIAILPRDKRWGV
jgi:hypothetical protein